MYYNTNYCYKIKNSELKYRLKNACFSKLVNLIRDEEGYKNLEYIKILIPFESSNHYKNALKSNLFYPTDEYVIKYIKVLQRDLKLEYLTENYENNNYHVILLKAEDYPSFGSLRHTMDLVRLCYEGNFCYKEGTIKTFVNIPKYCDWYIVLQLCQQMMYIKDGHNPFCLTSKLSSINDLKKGITNSKEITGWSFYQKLPAKYTTNSSFILPVEYTSYTKEIIALLIKSIKTKKEKEILNTYYEFITNYKNLTEANKKKFYETIN